MNRVDAKGTKNTWGAEPSAELDQVAHRVIGAAIEVHRLLGPGFLESVYEEALCVELRLRGIRFARQVPIAMKYKDYEIGEARLDLVVEELLVVELKRANRSPQFTSLKFFPISKQLVTDSVW